MHKSRHLCRALLLCTGLLGTAWAQPISYMLDPLHTLPRFSYRHLGLSTQLSRFDKVSGVIVLDQAARTGSVDVEIDMRSIDSGVEALNALLKSADYLDVDRYPSATFKASTIVFDGERPVSAQGQLTIKGVTQEVTFTINNVVTKLHPAYKKEVLGADASLVILRSAFHAGKLVPFVSDEVSITISLEAHAH